MLVTLRQGENHQFGEVHGRIHIEVLTGAGQVKISHDQNTLANGGGHTIPGGMVPGWSDDWQGELWVGAPASAPADVQFNIELPDNPPLAETAIVDAIRATIGKVPISAGRKGATA